MMIHHLLFGETFQHPALYGSVHMTHAACGERKLNNAFPLAVIRGLLSISCDTVHKQASRLMLLLLLLCSH